MSDAAGGRLRARTLWGALPARAPWVVVLGGAVLAGLALLDPIVGKGEGEAAGAGALLAATGLALGRVRGRVSGKLVVAATLAFALALGAWTSPTFFRADSVSYYAYLRSAAFDHDLDFANEWQRWGYPPPPKTPTGHRTNTEAVGPALLWSPFFLLAHLYVLTTRALRGGYSADGFSLPYYRATAAGTIVVAVCGAALLARTIAKDLGLWQAGAIVALAALASPVAYYVFVLPAMSHGPAYGVAAAAVWACDRARRGPSRRAWLIVGALVGLLALTRWQAAVFGLLVLPLAAEGLARRQVRLGWLACTALVALLAFTPQLVAWKILYGRWLTLPQGAGFVDWRSPHLVDVLLSADHGFLVWTPAMALGILGLMLSLRRDPIFAAGALMVLAATAWVNGGVRDWTASDAFGARRFDVIVPLATVGLGVLCQGAAGLVSRRPYLVPGAVLAALVLWNLGLIDLFQRGRFTRATPLAPLLSAQAEQARRASETAAGRLLGWRGRALLYKALVGEYFYDNVNPSGTIAVGAPKGEFLAEGWSAPHRREGWPPFRWAQQPEACVRVPLHEPFDLGGFVTVRAPGRIPDQTIDVVVNGSSIMKSAVGAEWADVPFRIPAAALVPGENRLCLRFARVLPGEEGSRAAVAVSVIQLR